MSEGTAENSGGVAVPSTSATENCDEYLLPKDKVSHISIEGYPQVKVYRSVKADDAPWMLFLHGLSFFTDICAAFLNLMAAHYNILSFDWPGVGGTCAPGDNAYTPEILLDFVVKVIDAVEPGLMERGVSVVGHSMGGLMSLVVAMHYAEKNIRVKNVVMLAPAGVKIHKWLTHRLILAPLVGKALTVLLNWFPTFTAKRTLDEARYNFHCMPKRMEQALWGPFKASVLQDPHRTTSRMLAFAHFPWEAYGDLFVELSKSGIHSVVVLGGNDVTVDSQTTEKFLREKCPSIGVKIYPEYHHDLVACNVEVVAEYVRSVMV